MFPSELGLCCSNGKHVLGPDLNPPIDEVCGRIATSPGIAKNSRYLNQRLAFGSVHTRPSRAEGGIGFTGQGETAVLDHHGVTSETNLGAGATLLWGAFAGLPELPYNTHGTSVYHRLTSLSLSVYQHYTLGPP